MGTGLPDELGGGKQKIIDLGKREAKGRSTKPFTGKWRSSSIFWGFFLKLAVPQINHLLPYNYTPFNAKVFQFFLDKR